MFVLELTVFFLICMTERGILFYSSIPAAILYSQKSSTDCKVAGGIRELHAAPIMFCNTAGRLKINIKKLVGFGRACAPVRCAHPSFLAH
jgi:hypothetical protein